MAVRREAVLVATTYADDPSLRSLADVTEITADFNVRIVGGQMTSLLLTAFPVSDIATRQTRDADAAITTRLAGSGALHARLVARGYTATSGNHYVRGVPELAPAGQLVPELRDAAAHLHELARQLRRHTDADVPPARLATLIAELVSRPG